MTRVRRSSQEILEGRYRRLLAFYPAAYRAANEEEMLGVALAGAGPGQTRPGMGETVDLIVSGLRQRLHVLRTGGGDPAWRDAAAVFVIIGSILIAAICQRPVASAMAEPLNAVIGFPALTFRAGDLVAAAGWSLVTVAAMLRWRRITAAGACLGAIGLAWRLALHYSGSPSGVVVSWWRLILTAVVALSAVVAAKGVTRPPSRRVIAAIAVAAEAYALAPVFVSWSVTTTSLPDGSTMLSGWIDQGTLDIGLVAALGATVLIAVVRLSYPVRRRVVILFLPAVAAAALVRWTFGGFIASSPRFVHPVLLTVPQWAALGAVPVLAFAVGTIWLRRHERMLHRISTAHLDTDLETPG